MQSTDITPAIKDKVLNYLCQHAIPEQVCSGNTIMVIAELDISFETFNAIMNQFLRKGLIEDLNLRQNAIHFILLVDALDFRGRGGFMFQEEILEANINTLLLEMKIIEKELGPKYLDTTEKIASIASSIISGFSLFKK